MPSIDLTAAEVAAYYRVLTKSTNYATREYGAEQLRKLELQAADVAKRRPYEGQRYTHGWIKVHPDEPAAVHHHIDAARTAMHDLATANAREHLDRALAAAQHGRTRRAIRRRSRELLPTRAGTESLDRDLLHAIR